MRLYCGLAILKNVTTLEALVRGNPRDAMKMSVIGAGRLREWFSEATTRGVADRWPLRGLAQLTIYFFDRERAVS